MYFKGQCVDDKLLFHGVALRMDNISTPIRFSAGLKYPFESPGMSSKLIGTGET